MKILFLLQDVPFPISDGMRWKVFHLLKYLSARHQCDVLAFTDGSTDLEQLKQALPNVNWLGTVERVHGLLRVIRGGMLLLTGQPASLARYSCGKFRRQLYTVLQDQKYDVLHCDMINMAQYWRDNIATVHSPNDATSLFYSRMERTTEDFLTKWRLSLGAHLLQRYEELIYPKFTKIHVVSKVDADYLRKIVPAADVAFIPFGVDSGKLPETRVSLNENAASASPLILILGGGNVPGVAAGIKEFVEVVLPQVSELFPQAVFQIQGRETGKLLKRLTVSPEVNLKASAWVEDLDALIEKASIVVLPDKAGTGIKTRALQSLACGATIVGTRVAFEGLQDYVEDGVHCAIADNADELSRKICELLANKEKCNDLGRVASAMVRSKLSWSILGLEYESLYTDAISKHGATRTKSNAMISAPKASRIKEPKISVCIPAYNRSSLLPALLDSIFRQDYENFEVVVIEDNSPEREDIARVSDEYAKKYIGKLVYAENLKNLGYDANLRRLIEVATGDYVVFMGNDDLMADGALRAIGASIQRYPDVGVILRSYASFHVTPGSTEQVFRYFDSESFFPAGKASITTFFRRCVFISGMVIRRDDALAVSTDRFDGTLLYQQHLVGEILSRRNGVYLTQILTFHRLGGTPDFGNSAAEKSLFVPKEQTVESSVHFMRGMLRIAASLEKSTQLPVYKSILRDIGNYSYPILSIQARRSRIVFFSYVRSLAKLGFWRVPLFYVYAFGLLFFGRSNCDRLVTSIKRRLGRAPKIGQVYSGIQ